MTTAAGAGVRRTASGWWPVVWPVALGVAGLAVWQSAVTAGVVDGYALPSPAAIAAEFAAFLPAIVEGAGVTGVNTLVGLVAGSVVAIALAAVAASTRPIDGMLAPIVAALAVVPIVALAPVLNTMFGADSQTGRQMIAGIATFTPVFLGTLRGLRQTAPVHRDLMRACAASGWQTFRAVTLPTATPHVVTGIRVASSLAVISALVAEYFGGPRGGLGGLISTYAAQSAYARSWAFVFGAILLGVLFYAATSVIERGVNARLGHR
ncbi:ABC transporter permease [Microbacterium karelineae]|uniref:ABC transporter permease n=1 Tax=Microbacterium karelineae TaxID=2654283 RepID=UPI0012EA41D5|nr:ABC transporter permease subunit [Microbacterium karelineae]